MTEEKEDRVALWDKNKWSLNLPQTEDGIVWYVDYMDTDVAGGNHRPTAERMKC